MRIMNRLPHESWELESPLDAVELALRLKPRLAHTWQLSWFWLRPTEDVLLGDVTLRGFKAFIWGPFFSNQSPVELKGKFQPHDLGTTISIRIAPPPTLALFSASFIVVVAVVFTAMLVSAYQNGEWHLPLIPAFMGAVWAFHLWWFKLLYRQKAPVAKKLLEELLAEVLDDAARNVALQPLHNTQPPPLPNS